MVWDILKKLEHCDFEKKKKIKSNWCLIIHSDTQRRTVFGVRGGITSASSNIHLLFYILTFLIYFPHYRPHTVVTYLWSFPTKNHPSGHGRRRMICENGFDFLRLILSFRKRVLGVIDTCLPNSWPKWLSRFLLPTHVLLSALDTELDAVAGLSVCIYVENQTSSCIAIKIPYRRSTCLVTGWLVETITWAYMFRDSLFLRRHRRN